MTSTDPLRAFRVVDARDFERVRSALVDTYDVRSFQPLGDEQHFSARASYFRFLDTSISFCAYGSPVSVSFRDDDYVRLQVCLRGTGHIKFGKCEAEVEPETLICSPADATLDFSANLQQFALRVSESALENDLALLLGVKSKQRISFDTTASAREGQSSRLRTLVMQTVAVIDCTDEPMPPPLLREMDQTIRLALLYGVANNYSGLLYAGQKASAPWQVKRIEEWIDANWKEDVTLDKLADITGASVRSIFATFKRARGYTPMTYLRKVRLKAAREMLLAAAPTASVTVICFACGFMNPGHFARDYKREFGELPSLTLQRGKGRG